MVHQAWGGGEGASINVDTMDVVEIKEKLKQLGVPTKFRNLDKLRNLLKMHI